MKIVSYSRFSPFHLKVNMEYIIIKPTSVCFEFLKVTLHPYAPGYDKLRPTAWHSRLLNKYKTVLKIWSIHNDLEY